MLHIEIELLLKFQIHFQVAKFKTSMKYYHGMPRNTPDYILYRTDADREP